MRRRIAEQCTKAVDVFLAAQDMHDTQLYSLSFQTISEKFAECSPHLLQAGPDCLALVARLIAERTVAAPSPCPELSTITEPQPEEVLKAMYDSRYTTGDVSLSLVLHIEPKQAGTEKRYRAHRFVLSARSAYFRELLGSPSGVGGGGGEVTIEVPSEREQLGLVHYLRYLYTGEVDPDPLACLLLGGVVTFFNGGVGSSGDE